MSGAAFEWEIESLREGRSLIYVAGSPTAIVSDTPGRRLILSPWLLHFRNEQTWYRHPQTGLPEIDPATGTERVVTQLRMTLDPRYASATAVALSELDAEREFITALRLAGGDHDRRAYVLQDFLLENPRVSSIPRGAIVYSDYFIWPDRADVEAYARRAGFTSRQFVGLNVDAPGVGHGQAWAIKTSEAAPPYRGNLVGPTWDADTRELVTNASADAGDLNRRAFTWLGTTRVSEVVDAYADDIVMNGGSGESAGEEGGPQYELLRFDAPRLEQMAAAYDAVAERYGILLTGAELHFIGAQAGAIVEYLDSGSVNVEWVDSDDRLQERWNQIEAGINPWRSNDPNADSADIEAEFRVAHPEYKGVGAFYEHGQWFVRATSSEEEDTMYSVVDTADGGIDFEELA